jgi:flagellar motor protein MotB
MKMHCSWIAALALVVAPAAAQPTGSQHPLAEVKFAQGGTTLSVADAQLGAVAAWAKENPEGMVVVEGHADRVGPARINLLISMKRADSVVEQLLVLGISRDQLVVAGFGSSGVGRRVKVWSSRDSYDVIEKQLRKRGAKTVQTSQVMASL